MKRKMRLDPDALLVETFGTGPDARNGGTVHGNNLTADSCDPCEVQPEDSINYCPPPPSAQGTCNYTCSCGCTYTRVGWTCDPYASECLPVPEQ
jgi:hypothetical protein